MKRRFLILSLMIFLTGCAETLLVPAIAPPTATYTVANEQKNHAFSDTSPKVQLLLLDDKRESVKLVRSTTGFQGLLYHATGWSIDSERPINELITGKIASHLEDYDIMAIAGENVNSTTHALGGEIITFNLDKKGGFSGKWVANVDLKIFLKNSKANKVIEYYRVSGTAEKTNWGGANSGIDALNEALEIAIMELDMKSIQSILVQNQ
ncbi:MAG TPA: hypothetical protein QF468_10540 [Nitrospinota bacterium]|jgi:hypothetical protein|nr:hypothetical protein [Nitrospinota bacterium]|tara:strand:+ start:1667 stop:2293 length:627 start_codon:yes stop_codon:yes gene_type:complete